jgi:hypothetical protein
MDKIDENKYPLVRQEGEEKKIVLPGYPTYPKDEDIYSSGKEEKEINPEQIALIKENVENGINNEKDFEDDESGDDLDVPGSELDDNEEKTGNEDEENNYYSLGGENHENLDEDSNKLD